MITALVSVVGLPAGTRVALVCGRRAVGVRWLEYLARRPRGGPRVVRLYRSNGNERLIFADGTTVHLMPCRPDSWRGEVFDVVIAPEGVSDALLPHVEAATATSILREWPAERRSAYSRARAVGAALAGGVVVALLVLPLVAYLAGWF